MIILDILSGFSDMEWLHNISFLDMMVKGIIIGIVVSAPMGPVGILCVQRTLNRGRWIGFATGVGAALSDIIYALITGYGMSMVVSIIENPVWSFWIRVAGCVLLFMFGLFTFRTNPAKNKNHAKMAQDVERQAIKAGKKYKNAKRQMPESQLEKITREHLDKLTPEKHKRSAKSRIAIMNNFMTGFLVTFSNPLIIFLFVALFGQFTFIRPTNPGPQFIGYLFIIVGALAWWFLLTWSVSKVRNKFDEKGILIINRIIGGVVMAVSAIIAICTFF